jgi:hypothetical protein
MAYQGATALGSIIAYQGQQQWGISGLAYQEQQQ